MVEGHEFPGGSGHAAGNVLKRISAELQSSEYRDTILRNVTYIV